MVSLPSLVRARTQKLGLAPTVVTTKNSQTINLLEAHLNTNPTVTAGKTLAMVDNSALVPNSSDGEAFLDAGASGTGEISIYLVRDGDTLDGIAKMFGVSKNTIVWANSLKGSTVAAGQELVILPVSGVKHTVVKGDTVSSIAKKYSADASDILAYNNLATDAALTPGQVIIVPDGEVGSAGSSSSGSGSTSTGTSGACSYTASHYEKLLVNPCKYPSYPGYYAKPIPGAPKTQELHGYNGVDLGASTGTAIGAAANGTVIVAKNDGGYNGGYGNYVVISHANGTQTLYAHMQRAVVAVGQTINQGQTIGYVGMTGKTTGPHLHFEVRGARNPF